jgi:hypothetical protein
VSDDVSDMCHSPSHTHAPEVAPVEAAASSGLGQTYISLMIGDIAFYLFISYFLWNLGIFLEISLPGPTFLRKYDFNKA